MYYIVETDKSFEQVSQDLEAAVAAHGFGVLHIHDLGATLRGKGIDFGEQCRVFEVCNPIQAAKVLATDMRLNMALPCRLSVFPEGGIAGGACSGNGIIFDISDPYNPTRIVDDAK